MSAIAFKDEKEEQLYKIRHSAAHVLATAVTELFPDVKVAGGPPIEDGFYYDFSMVSRSSGVNGVAREKS